MSAYNILILGASYGSLLASKILLGGHSVKLVCLPAEADLINSEGFRVRIPIRGRSEPIELDSRKLPGRVSAAGATDVDPREYDLIGLAMQEPQYGSPGVRELMNAVATSRVPCMSIMNMPPFPYMRRVPGIDSELLKPAYTAPEVWEEFDPATLTLCSPDPQAIRPPDEKANVLQVTLPTNFKVARFDVEKGNEIVRRGTTVCNLYSITTNQAAIIALFRVVNRYVGNLAPMPGVFPDYQAPIVRNGADGRELATARWGMPSSQFAQMHQATKKRAAKLEATGKPVDFKELLRMEPDGGTTNIRNVGSKHWARWLGAESRCIVPFNSFSEFNKAAGGDVWFALDKTRPLACFAGIWTNWTSVRKVKKGDPRARDRARRRPPALLRTRPSPKLATHSTRSATPFRNACPTSGDRERMVRQST